MYNSVRLFQFPMFTSYTSNAHLITSISHLLDKDLKVVLCKQIQSYNLNSRFLLKSTHMNRNTFYKRNKLYREFFNLKTGFSPY